MASMPQANRTAPTKGKQVVIDPGREQVAKLNHTYNLGVPLADPHLSPADKEKKARLDDNFRRHNAITNLLRFHYYKGTEHLQVVLADFDKQAREQSSTWVRKPRGDRSLLPGSANAPRALLVEDQTSLQELLLDILEASKASAARRAPQSSLLSPLSSGGDDRDRADATFTGHTNAKKGVKQVDFTNTEDKGAVPSTTSAPQKWLYEDLKQLAASVGMEDKYSDGRGHQNVSRAAVQERDDNFIPGQYVESDVVDRDAEFWMEPNRPRSPSTSSTSSAMYSALDSFEVPTDSQTTVGAESDAPPDDEMGTSRTLRRSLSKESFAASDTDLLALEESFNLYGNGNESSPATGDRPPGSPATTEPSSIPELADLRLSDFEEEERDPAPAESVPGLAGRLASVFPATPSWLEQAPFPIIWEFVRIALHCGVDLDAVDMDYSLSWEDQNTFRSTLSQHPQFEDKRLPERSSQVAWDTALNRHVSQGGPTRMAVYAVAMSYNKGASGPLYGIRLQPIAIDLSHRLGRHFGPGRFLEILLPSHHSAAVAVPRVLRNHEAAVHEVNRWLTRQRHNFVGRNWAAFYVKDGEPKKTAPTKVTLLGESEELILLKRVYLFAEDGYGIAAPSEQTASRTAGLDDDSYHETGPLKVHAMLDWLLQYNKFPENRSQPFLKLFSRIALGLSRTKPTVEFETHQIRHQAADIMSPVTGKVMNDGVARMSLSVARKLRSALELSDLPTAVQGRLGSAKGMWILDTEDIGREDWIETYPSQRKWRCDFADKDQRTLEIRNLASEVHSASLNHQFISVLESRARDKARMRQVIGRILEGSLHRDLEKQREALEHPLLFMAWAHENSRYQNERAVHCQVPFLGGLPDRDEEVIKFLLSGGFDPLQQRFLWDKTYDMQRRRCEVLREKLSVRVGRTAYLLMVVDFLGVLEEGEVQVCFSSKFHADADDEPNEHSDDGSFSDTLLVGTDVLVARSPAHFASDIQKVRAVFRPELCALKDVIIFSSKGDSPLADKLSGGDYDGDRAWVCWDSRVVDNFVNAPEPPKMDLVEMGYMRKIKTTLDHLRLECDSMASDQAGQDSDIAPVVVDSLIERSFAFNMKENLLGKLTVYKEYLCYHRGSIDDRTANVLSTLLSDLVDQAKQGVDFSWSDFNRLRAEQLEGYGAAKMPLAAKMPPPERHPKKPAYKGSTWSAQAKQRANIIDYLKFGVARPIVTRELKALNALRETIGARASNRGGSYWDPDLAEPAKHFEALADKSYVCYAIFEALKSDLQVLRGHWDTQVKEWHIAEKEDHWNGDTGDPGYRQRFLQVYQQWCDITVRLPQFSSNDGDKRGTPTRKKALTGADADVMEAIPRILQQSYLSDPEYSQWALLRASQAFRMFYKNPALVWRLAGRQLQVIKASMTGAASAAGSNGGLGGAKVLMTPLTYAGLRPDKKLITQIAARLRGAGVAGVDYDDPDAPFADDT